MRGRWTVVAGGALAVLLTGCASASTADVSAVATAFENPSGDPQARCDLLAPATRATFESESSAPCADAIRSVQLPGGKVGEVQIWGGDAQVRLGGDTLFLTQSDTGWKVTAAGCQSRGEEPYDCRVDGP